LEIASSWGFNMLGDVSFDRRRKKCRALGRNEETKIRLCSTRICLLIGFCACIRNGVCCILVHWKGGALGCWVIGGFGFIGEAVVIGAMVGFIYIISNLIE
jgi:hypothetical protein